MKRNILLTHLPERYNWSERVQNAASLGRFNLTDKMDVDSWERSITSEIDSSIERFEPGNVPVDQTLQILDGLFTASVKENDFDTAAVIIYAVSNREHELLMEMIFTE